MVSMIGTILRRMMGSVRPGSFHWQSRAADATEYACHEGNEGLPGALSGDRAQEKADAKEGIQVIAIVS
jgi:hypothetical protein